MKPPKKDRNLLQAYKGEHPWCELLGYLDGEKWERKIQEYNEFFGVRFPEHWPVETLELHHIFQGKDRWDIWPNLIHVSVAAHTFAHENPPLVKVASMYVKFIKGDLNEDTLGLMRRCFGFCPIGRMSAWDVTEQWAKDMRTELEENFSCQDWSERNA